MNGGESWVEEEYDAVNINQIERISSTKYKPSLSIK
jgi:hypothetical protein